jgi:SAM-dependent methyltransferase
MLAKNERPIESMSSILDFGCGCGRVARWWADLDDSELHACDYNPELVGWCDRELPFLEAKQSGLRPPLPYPAARFEFAYALSVFTHLSPDLERSWAEELRRILRPGGLLFVTVHGEPYIKKLPRSQRSRFLEGEPVVAQNALAGTNLCSAFHPARYVEEEMFPGFELVDSVRPQEHPDRASPSLPQDAYLLRAR